MNSLLTDNEIYQNLRTELEELVTTHKVSGESAREIMGLARNYKPDDLLAAYLLCKPGRLTRQLAHDVPLAATLDAFLE